MLAEHLKILTIDDHPGNLTALSSAINLLVIEDKSADFQLIVRHLEKHGLAARCHCVSNIAEMEAAVEKGGWDAVLSDYSVPNLDFQHTLGLLQSRHPDLPLILVSGDVGEGKAVDLLKMGVWDFVLKDSLTRLVPAIERSLMDAAVRREQRVAEAALHESEEQFRAMFEMASIGMVQADPRTGQWLRVNQKVCEITGYSAAELLQLRIAELTYPEDRQKEAEAFQRVVRGEAPNYRIEKRYLRKDGAVTWVNVNMTVIRDAVGHPTRTMATIEDITDRKQAESFQEMSREVLQILNEPGELHDSMQRVVSTLRKSTGFDAVGIRLLEGEDFPYYAQEGFSNEFLITENSVIERTSNGAICRNQEGIACLECTCGLVISGKAPPDRPFFTPGGSFWTNESNELLDIPHADDPRHHPRNLCIHHGYDSVALIPIRTTERIVGTIQFNAHRKGCFIHETVEILEGIAATIGQAVMRKLTEEKLKEAVVRAEAAANAKAEFLSVMSHELRTPLHGVLGFAEILAATELDEKQVKYVGTIRQSGDHLLAVVNDILDYSSLEKGQLILSAEPFSVAGLMESCGRTIRKSATDKGLACCYEVAGNVPEQIVGDERRIRQILLNLLGNAVKFTPSGSVSLRVAAVSVEDRLALDFLVEDTGIGISPEALDALFKPFKQVDSTISRQFGGTGLGLVIANRLAEAMDGSISVGSTPKKGSAFTFRLPMETVPSPQTESVFPPPGSDQPSGGKPSPVAGALVLLVEDNATCSKLTGAMLEHLGYRVEYAINGFEALHAFQKGKFAAVLMDMQMPVMDGLVATQKIREIEAALGGRVPIIALTANVMPGDPERCLAAGMDDYLSKPFKTSELTAMLAQSNHGPA